MKPIYQLITLCLLALSVMACGQKEGNEANKNWRVGVTMPYEFPAVISEALAVNEEAGWRKILLQYTSFKIDDLQRQTNADYNGYAMALTKKSHYLSIREGEEQPDELPDKLVINWWAFNNYQQYQTEITITPQIKAVMTKKYTDSQSKKRCYRTDLILGLLPEGKVKLWLKGCRYYTYIDEYSASKILTPTVSYTAKDKPVPWDKVNQVWVDPDYQLQNLDDVVSF